MPRSRRTRSSSPSLSLSAPERHKAPRAAPVRFCAAGCERRNVHSHRTNGAHRTAIELLQGLNSWLDLSDTREKKPGSLDTFYFVKARLSGDISQHMYDSLVVKFRLQMGLLAC